MHPTAEHQPTRIAVVLEMPTERGDREHRVASRGAWWHRLLRHCFEDAELFGRKRLRGRWICFGAGEVTQQKQPPGDRREDCERVQETLRRLDGAVPEA